MALPKLKYKFSLLTNGIPVLTHHTNTRGIQIGVILSFGSMHEEPFLGSMHYYEHMAFKGTLHRTPLQINGLAEILGAKLNAATGHDNIAFYINGLAQHTSRLFSLLADIVLNPTFPADEFEKERGVIIEEINAKLDDPEEIVGAAVDQLIYPNHPINRNIVGSVDSVQAITRENLLAINRNHVGPPNLFIVAVGGSPHLRIIQLAQRLFGGCPTKSSLALIGPDTGLSAEEKIVTIHHADLNQAHLEIAFRAPNVHDNRALILSIISHALAQNTASRLWERLREKDGMVYNINSLYGGIPCCGFFTIDTQFSPQNLVYIQDTIFQEIENIRCDGLSEVELKMIKQGLANRYKMRTLDPLAVFEDLIDCHLYSRPYNLDNTFWGLDLGGVDNGKIIEAAREFLQRDLARVAILQPAD